MAEVEKLIARKIDTAILRYKMIEPGDRILLAVSGGKDSLTLAHHLCRKARASYPCEFEVQPVYVATDFAEPEAEDQIRRVVPDLDVITVNVKRRIKEGQKMGCYWCSTQRRVELMKYADKNGYNKIALGHHMDDLLETFLMNMTHKGEMSTMPPVMPYDNYPQVVIRPLTLVREAEIIAFAEKEGYRRIVCECGYDTNSHRREMREVLDLMVSKRGESVKETMFRAISKKPIERYMPYPVESPIK